MEYGYDFFLDSSNLPKGFKYPKTYINYVSNDFEHMDSWHFYCSNLLFAYLGLKKRYPSKSMVPFARKIGSDDIACFDSSIILDEPQIMLIHDFASDGWEYRGIFKNFIEWLEFAKKDNDL